MPKQGSDKGQAQGSHNQSKAADGRVPKAGSLSPRQHPPAQLVHVPAHTGFSFGLIHHSGCKLAVAQLWSVRHRCLIHPNHFAMPVRSSYIMMQTHFQLLHLLLVVDF